MSARALLFAAGGALAGAALWAAVMVLTGYEVGWVAWGIGALVGGTAAWAGARGSTSGVVCAVLALVAIFAGKVYGIRHVVVRDLEKTVFTRANFDEQVQDAGTSRRWRRMATTRRSWSRIATPTRTLQAP